MAGITSAFQMFQPNGPLGYWPNNYAANAGDLPTLLGLTGGAGNTPILNGFSPVLPPLVTGIFNGAAPPLGTPMRPLPFGAFNNNVQTGATSLNGTGSTINSGLTGGINAGNFLAGTQGMNLMA